MITHPIPPEYDEYSRILILGSFPSVKSRETGYFYGHPQNRFWKVTSAVFQDETPVTVHEKQAFLKRHHIALWDVIASCDITGSSDSSIRNVVPNDLRRITDVSPIERIFVNGKKAFSLFQKYALLPETLTELPEAICLPSTSPANAAWSLEKLIEAWRMIRL
ncbi:MAG: DNA-deoxyinosine glycosylase [Lachnospiraceae bacterium]|nr:DNA-deoxyinosine glycosylase [Lachnospiraceae bacterium]MBR2275067.1 DNA-deoxyinosine glycosylase [Lachnospiraceae bacterium]